MFMSTTAIDYRLHDQDVILDSDEQYTLRVKDLAEEDRPREKLLSAGPHSLSLAELVAIVWVWVHAKKTC
jgi:hypothetical protein